jgi:hypothetical protein
MNRTLLSIGALVVAALIYFAGDHFGYTRGYHVAYTSEHSHYVFEKRRADHMLARITGNRRCVSKMAGNIPTVQDSGFAGLGERFAAFGMMYWGTVHCNQTAGFGYIDAKEYARIMPGND